MDKIKVLNNPESNHVLCFFNLKRHGRTIILLHRTIIEDIFSFVKKRFGKKENML